MDDPLLSSRSEWNTEASKDCMYMYWVGKAIHGSNASKDKSGGSACVCIDQQWPWVSRAGDWCKQDLVTKSKDSKTVANKSTPVCGVDYPNSSTTRSTATEANVVKTASSLDTWNNSTINQHEGRWGSAAEGWVRSVNKFVERNTADCGDKVIRENRDRWAGEPVGGCECYVEVTQNADAVCCPCEVFEGSKEVCFLILRQWPPRSAIRGSWHGQSASWEDGCGDIVKTPWQSDWGQLSWCDGPKASWRASLQAGWTTTVDLWYINERNGVSQTLVANVWAFPVFKCTGSAVNSQVSS